MTSLEELTQLIQSHINQKIVVQYGSIGTGYIHILIVKGGEIKSIGECLYRLWYENTWKHYENSFVKFSQDCEKYRNNEIDYLPSLHYVDQYKLSYSNEI